MNPGRSAFSSGGGVVPPHASDLDRGPPWGLSVPVPCLSSLSTELFTRHLPLSARALSFFSSSPSAESALSGSYISLPPSCTRPTWASLTKSIGINPLSLFVALIVVIYFFLLFPYDWILLNFYPSLLLDLMSVPTLPHPHPPPLCWPELPLQHHNRSDHRVAALQCELIW